MPNSNNSGYTSSINPIGTIPNDYIVSTSPPVNTPTKKLSSSSSLSGEATTTPTLKHRLKKLRRNGSTARSRGSSSGAVSPVRRKIPPVVSLPPREQPIQKPPASVNSSSSAGYFFPQTKPLSPNQKRNPSPSYHQRNYVNYEIPPPIKEQKQQQQFNKPAYQQAHIHSPKQRSSRPPTQPTILEHPINSEEDANTRSVGGAAPPLPRKDYMPKNEPHQRQQHSPARPNVRTDLLRRSGSLRRTYSKQQAPNRKNSINSFQATPTSNNQQLPARNGSVHNLNRTPSVGSRATPPGSPQMLVRKRSTAWSAARGNPVRRFFAKLFRWRRHKAKLNFSKLQLRRKLSFEVKESPDKVSKYSVKNIQLLNLRPNIHRFKDPKHSKEEDYYNNNNRYPEKPLTSLKNTSYLLREHDAMEAQKKQDSEVGGGERGMEEEEEEEEEEPLEFVRHPTPPLALNNNNEQLSSGGSDQDFREFDFDYRNSTDKEPVAATASSDPSSIPAPDAERQVSSASNARRRDNYYYYDSPEEVSQFARKRTISTRRKPSSIKRGSGSQKLPLITRVDFYDNPNPALDLETSGKVTNSRGGSMRRNNSTKSLDEATGNQVSEALAFVDTWSSYLRRAVAVRVVLRQEIHSLEEQEEEEWRKSMERTSYNTSSDNDSLYSSASTMTSATSTSGTSSPVSRSVSPSSGLASRTNSQHESVISTTTTNQDYASPQRGIYGNYESENTDDNNNAPARNITSSFQVPPEKQKRVSEIKQSLGDFQKRYSSLIRPQSSSPAYRHRSVQSIPGSNRTSTTEYHRQNYRSSSDSLASLMKPGRESAWLRSNSSASARPLPAVPGGRTDTRISSVPEKVRPISSAAVPDFTPVLHEQRSESDKILKDMYQELEELQYRSAKLSDLVKGSDDDPRDSGIKNEQVDYLDPLPDIHNMRMPSEKQQRQQYQSSHESMEAQASEESSSKQQHSPGGSGVGLQRGGVNRRRTPKSKFMRESKMAIDTNWKPQTEADTESIRSSSQDSGISFDGPVPEWRHSVGKHPLFIEVGDASRPSSVSEARFI